MSREKTLFIIAILMMVAPHLGLTNLMEQIAFFVLGLIVLIFAYGLYFEKRAGKKKPESSSTHQQPKRKHIHSEHIAPIKKETIEPNDSHGFVVLKKREESKDNNFTI